MFFMQLDVIRAFESTSAKLAVNCPFSRRILQYDNGSRVTSTASSFFIISTESVSDNAYEIILYDEVNNKDL